MKKVPRRVPLILVLVGTLVLMDSSLAQTSAPCATTLSAWRTLLDDASFPVHWQETSMHDAKPLVVSVLESNGSLQLEFFKTGEGLWAQSRGAMCPTATGFEIRFGREQVALGPAAHWVLRLALADGGKFTLTRPHAGQLHIATSGWSGDFSPSASPPDAPRP